MRDSSLIDVTGDQFDAAERITIDVIRAAYPNLDQRRGTVIRDALVRPGAFLAALNRGRVERLRRSLSLASLLEDELATPEDANRILENFNIAQGVGSRASGLIRINVDASRSYTLPSGFSFRSISGLVYVIGSVTTVKPDAVEAHGEIPLRQGFGASYYFIVPAVAASAGSEYNIAQGSALDATTRLYGFISASAYANFTGGSDAESLLSVIARIPAALSHRALTNRTAIEAQLLSRFEQSNIAIRAISVQGYGDGAQRRDKHNVFGIAVGGRVDVYARTFTTPSVVVLEKTGKRVSQGVYSFDIAVSDSPGFYAIRSISDHDSVAVGSYRHTEKRDAHGLNETRHDIDPAAVEIETAFTAFQTSSVTVFDVPASTDAHLFRVELYGAPGISELQRYVDDDAVRNVAADFIVRSPLVCLVTVSANVYYTHGDQLNFDAIRNSLAAYINERSFVPCLTRSELASIIIALGAKRVSLDKDGMKLEGRVRDAAGVWHTLEGDTLDIRSVARPAELLTPETCVFAIEPQNIHLVGVPE